MRMALNQLQYMSLSMSVIKYDDVRQRLLSSAKDEDISPFTAVDKYDCFPFLFVLASCPVMVFTLCCFGLLLVLTSPCSTFCIFFKLVNWTEFPSSIHILNWSQRWLLTYKTTSEIVSLSLLAVYGLLLFIVLNYHLLGLPLTS